MKDIQSREIVIGSGVLYAVGGKLVTGVVRDIDGDKLVVDKDAGGTSTVTYSDDKFWLL